MMFEMLYSKIHRATVTDANLNYVGSITIDKDLIEAAKLKIGQKVDVLNINNGERISTYVIEGERGSGVVCLNGAAARRAAIGDKIIIVAYVMIDEKELPDFKPAVILVDDANGIIKKEEYL
ncbi:MAG: aspartate 1-decarboxylase [Campylobacteraceae bacterium]|jgi:aspartate 1-decarboxylase|nr:aspartate 1-decarboxylase [Campylobacteraceae bacterium]